MCAHYVNVWADVRVLKRVEHMRPRISAACIMNEGMCASQRDDALVNINRAQRDV